MTRAIPQVAFAIAKDKEELVLFAYDDAHWPPKECVPGDLIQGTLTAGYGHTGPDVTIGMKVTQEIADEWMTDDLCEAAYELEKKIGAPVIEEMSDNQYAATIDFVMNLGTGNPKNPEWTIWKRLRARAWDQVPLEMAKFVNATVKDKDGIKKTVKLNGLVDRRNAEIGLWAMQEKGSENQNLPSSVTRATATPPTNSDPTPILKKGSIRAALVAAGTAAVPMAEQIGNTSTSISKKISPFADHSPYVQHALGILATVSAICVGLTVFLMMKDHRNANN